MDDHSEEFVKAFAPPEKHEDAAAILERELPWTGMRILRLKLTLRATIRRLLKYYSLQTDNSTATTATATVRQRGIILVFFRAGAAGAGTFRGAGGSTARLREIHGIALAVLSPFPLPPPPPARPASPARRCPGPGPGWAAGAPFSPPSRSPFSLPPPRPRPAGPAGPYASRLRQIVPEPIFGRFF